MEWTRHVDGSIVVWISGTSCLGRLEEVRPCKSRLMMQRRRMGILHEGGFLSWWGGTAVVAWRLGEGLGIWWGLGLGCIVLWGVLWW